MTPFGLLEGVAAPLPADNVDTDQIIPARYLKTIRRTGLGRGLFADLRRDPGFVLNRPAYADAVILVTGPNFGCGSSREHASWALLDGGIRCVIAPSFGDIFASNALKNGLLPAVVSPEASAALTADAESGAPITVDLERQVVRGTAGDVDFAVDPLRRRMLIEGLDDIGVTLRHAPALERYERSRPGWLA